MHDNSNTTKVFKMNMYNIYSIYGNPIIHMTWISVRDEVGGIYVGIMSMGTHSCVSVLVFTRLTKVPGADPEITVRGGGGARTLFRGS